MTEAAAPGPRLFAAGYSDRAASVVAIRRKELFANPMYYLVTMSRPPLRVCKAWNGPTATRRLSAQARLRFALTFPCPGGRAWRHPLRQRPACHWAPANGELHRPGGSGPDHRHQRPDGSHRARRTLASGFSCSPEPMTARCSARECQCPLSRFTPERHGLLQPARGANPDPAAAAARRQGNSPQRIGLSPASPENRLPDGSGAVHAKTFRPDHAGGADQPAALQDPPRGAASSSSSLATASAPGSVRPRNCSSLI